MRLWADHSSNSCGVSKFEVFLSSMCQTIGPQPQCLKFEVSSFYTVLILHGPKFGLGTSWFWMGDHLMNMGLHMIRCTWRGGRATAWKIPKSIVGNMIIPWSFQDLRPRDLQSSWVGSSWIFSTWLGSTGNVFSRQAFVKPNSRQGSADVKVEMLRVLVPVPKTFFWLAN